MKQLLILIAVLVASVVTIHGAQIPGQKFASFRSEINLLEKKGLSEPDSREKVDQVFSEVYKYLMENQTEFYQTPYYMVPQEVIDDILPTLVTIILGVVESDMQDLSRLRLAVGIVHEIISYQIDNVWKLVNNLTLEVNDKEPRSVGNNRNKRSIYRGPSSVTDDLSDFLIDLQKKMKGIEHDCNCFYFDFFRFRDNDVHIVEFRLDQAVFGTVFGLGNIALAPVSEFPDAQDIEALLASLDEPTSRLEKFDGSDLYDRFHIWNEKDMTFMRKFYTAVEPIMRTLGSDVRRILAAASTPTVDDDVANISDFINEAYTPFAEKLREPKRSVTQDGNYKKIVQDALAKLQKQGGIIGAEMPF